ncbi:MAG TPA: hypothetical protein VFD03_12690 [Clostridia bacterium]|nr:hypothetical protein [Clostridia bacterium]
MKRYVSCRNKNTIDFAHITGLTLLAGLQDLSEEDEKRILI